MASIGRSTSQSSMSSGVCIALRPGATIAISGRRSTSPVPLRSQATSAMCRVRVDPFWEIAVVQRQAWGRVRGCARGLREAKAWVDERARRGSIHRVRLDRRSRCELQIGDLLDLEVGLTCEAQRVEIHEVRDALSREPTHDRRVLRCIGGLDDGSGQRDSLIEERGSLKCILDREPVVLSDARQVGEVAEQSVERRWHTRH
jgi:hypothetical protein